MSGNSLQLYTQLVLQANHNPCALFGINGLFGINASRCSLLYSVLWVLQIIMYALHKQAPIARVKTLKFQIGIVSFPISKEEKNSVRLSGT